MLPSDVASQAEKLFYPNKIHTFIHIDTFIHSFIPSLPHSSGARHMEEDAEIIRRNLSSLSGDWGSLSGRRGVRAQRPP